MGEHRFMAGFAFRAPGVPSPCHPANAAALRLCRGPVPAPGAIPARGDADAIPVPAAGAIPALGGVTAIPVPAADAIPSAWGCHCCPCCLVLSPLLVPSPLQGCQCHPCCSPCPQCWCHPHSLRVSVLFLLPVPSLLPVPLVPTLGKLRVHNPGFPAGHAVGFSLWHSQRVAVPRSLPGCHSRR